MSYPCFWWRGHKFSLIPPFTLDDKIIVKIETDCNHYEVAYDSFNRAFINRRRIRLSFTIEDGEQYDFTVSNDLDWDGIVQCNEYNDMIESTLNNPYYNPAANIAANIAVSLACSQIIDYVRTSDTTYVQELYNLLRQQCSYFTSPPQNIHRNISDNSYLRNMHRQLQEQGRLVVDRMRIRHMDFRNGESINCDLEFFNYDACINGSTTREKPAKTKIIHHHDYTPTYKKHYLPEENESTTLLLGAEIEVDNGGKSETHAQEVLRIMNGYGDDNCEKNIYCVRDGSLHDGLEFPTQPCSLAYHKTLPYKEMFEYLDKNGYAAHDTSTCGLHIHINRSFFGDKEAECIGKLMFIIEKFSEEFSAIGRCDCRYSRLLGYNGEKCKELYSIGYKNRDKYNAINLLHKDTIEIRAFKGTLKYSTYINTLEFVQDLAYFVKNHSEEEVENMEWKDLYNTFSDELKGYYDERVMIADKKEIENNKYQFAVSNNTLNRNYTWMDVDLSRYIVDPPNLAEQNDANIPDRNDSFNRIIDELNSIRESSFTATASMQCLAESCDNIAKEPKKKLKQLKKQLKTEQNYMARVNIQREINELNKAIKKSKKCNN